MNPEILVKHAGVLEALKFYGVGLENLEEGHNLKEIEKKQVSFSIMPGKREQANKYYSVIKEKQHVIDYLIKASKVGIDKVGNIKVEKSLPKSVSEFETKKDFTRERNDYNSENREAEMFRRELRSALESIKIDENNEIVKRGTSTTNTNKSTSYSNKPSFNNEDRQQEQPSQYRNNQPTYNNTNNQKSDTALVVWIGTTIVIMLLLAFMGAFKYEDGEGVFGAFIIVGLISLIPAGIAAANEKGRK